MLSACVCRPLPPAVHGRSNAAGVVRRRLLEQSDAALKDIRSRSRSSGGATDSEPISKSHSANSGGTGGLGGRGGLPRNFSFPSGSGLGLVQSSPSSPPRDSSGGGRLTRPPGAPWLTWFPLEALPGCSASLRVRHFIPIRQSLRL